MSFNGKENGDHLELKPLFVHLEVLSMATVLEVKVHRAVEMIRPSMILSFTVERSSRIFWSAYRYSGSWSPDKYCSGKNDPVVGFDVRETSSLEPGDDVDLYCKMEAMF